MDDGHKQIPQAIEEKGIAITDMLGQCRVQPKVVCNNLLKPCEFFKQRKNINQQ